MNRTGRILGLVVIVAGAGLIRPARAEPAAAPRPNILLIYSDD
jgi:hypothetical protein